MKSKHFCNLIHDSKYDDFWKQDLSFQQSKLKQIKRKGRIR
jgi:hypothetical protein